LLTGILARPEANPLLASLAGESLWWEQVKAILVTLVLAVVATAVLAYLVRAVVGLRVDEEVETIGLDLSEHGEEGYHGA
jgi:Amt family ammonium transporter